MPPRQLWHIALAIYCGLVVAGSIGLTIPLVAPLTILALIAIIILIAFNR
jgi:hypothetical protein